MSSPQQGGPKLACLVCRHRKVACDRKRPRCSLCSKNNFECEYKARQSRPGLRAGYVSRLEQQLIAVEERLRRVETQLESGGPTSSNSTYSAAAALAETETLPSSSPGFGGVTSDYAPARNDQHVSPECLGPSDLVLRGNHGYPPTTFLDSGIMARPGGLTPESFSKSLRIWLQKYHSWFPIIHKSSLQELETAGSTAARYDNVLKAITAVAILDDEDSTTPEKEMAARTRDEIMLHGTTVASLESIQSLLILSNHYYVEGNLTQFWNVLAMCQRMCMHLGLHTLATTPVSSTPKLHQSVQSIASSVVEREEAIRAYWMTSMLDSISTLGLSSCLSSLTVPPAASLPCSEATWALQSPVINHFVSPQVQFSSTFSLCIILAMQELDPIHRFSTESYDSKSADERQDWQTEAQRLDERLTNWREEFVAAVFRLINSEKDHLPQGEMEPFITLTNCVLNTAIIVLMQQMAPFPKDIGRDCEPWPFATSRCVYACENMAAKVRRIGEHQLDSQSPHLIFPVFAAARFYVVYSKALEADVPANLRSLAFYLHSCGKRSPLARRYEIIIRTAVGEHRSPLLECVLPVEFYDLRYSTLEVTELLQEAAERLSPRGGDVNVGAANNARWL